MIDFTGKKVLIVSDTHFGHKKMVASSEDRFERIRRYNTTDEMDQDIIDRWNEQVDSSTVVIFLGDFLMNCPIKETSNRVHFLLHKLNKPAEFYWIVGNHDHVIRKKVPDIHMQRYITFKYKGRTYFAQHYGFSEDEFGYDDKILNELIENGEHFDVLVHGHSHSDQKVSKTNRADEYQYQNCVCWDAWYRLVDPAELRSAQ